MVLKWGVSLIVKDLNETKQGLEMSLKNAKTNEKLLYSEIDHLRDKTDNICGGEKTLKDEIERLKTQNEEVSL